MTVRTPSLCFLTACVLGLTACGDDEPKPAVAPSPTAMSCPDVPVPGHLAENVKATGLTCEATVLIATAAEGRGRAPYDSNGFACTPADGQGAKTNYSCTMGEAKLTFLYGAA